MNKQFTNNYFSLEKEKVPVIYNLLKKTDLKSISKEIPYINCLYKCFIPNNNKYHKPLEIF